MTDAPTKPKRFYSNVDVAPAGGAWAVLLDGRALKTPAKADFAAPTKALAEVVAAEWSGQGEELEIADMHATRLVNVALDRIPHAREDTVEHVAGYLKTDLVCHLADDEPRLLKRQDEVWRPLREWAAENLGVRLLPASGIVAQDQPPESLEAGRAVLRELDDVPLAATAHATALFSSAVLAFALLKERIDAAAAFAASRVDEEFQQEFWGVDAEAAARAQRIAEEAAAIERVMRAS